MGHQHSALCWAPNSKTLRWTLTKALGTCGGLPAPDRARCSQLKALCWTPTTGFWHVRWAPKSEALRWTPTAGFGDVCWAPN